MTLEPDHTLLHYRILAKIGEGGMGEVWRARDTKLDREVAIKVLPREMAENPQYLARLEREAKAIAAMSHPNILAVHDFATDEGTSFVVTELLEGEPLRELLARGPLAPRKAAELARQVARGLASAHDKGIVHRDIKPENLFVTRDGRVKILDFGLATDRSLAHDTGDGATRTSLTAPGTVLGTVDYMSPEQVRGEPADPRSDIFSLGTVLYEMVSGARAFHRDTAAETMTAILREDPPELASTSVDVSPALSTIARRCLEKRVGERFHSAHDLAFSLEAASNPGVSSGATSGASVAGVAGVGESAEPRRRRGWTAVVVAGLLGAVFGAALLDRVRPAPEAAGTPTFTPLSSRRGTVTNARFVPGDDSAVYSAAWNGGPLRLYPADRNSRTSDALAIGDADLLAVSPAGEMAVALDRRHPFGWERVGTLAVVRPGGSAPRQVLEDVHVADWSPDGQNLAVAHEVDGRVRLEYPIGTVLYESPGWISDLRVHPDGKRVLIADCADRGDNFSRLRVVHTDGRVEEAGIGGSWGAVWAPDGETIRFSHGSALHAVRPGSAARPLLTLSQAVRLNDIDDRGRMLVAPADIRREMLVHPRGREELDLSWLAWTTPQQLSPDGRHILFEEGDFGSEEGYPIFLRDSSGGAPLPVGTGAIIALSPDARWVATLKYPFDDDRYLEIIPTGPGVPRRVDLGDVEMIARTGAWLDGVGDGGADVLLFMGREGNGPPRIYSLGLRDGAVPRAVTPEGLALSPRSLVASNDGTRFLVKPAEGAAVEFGLGGDGPRAVAGVEASDVPLRYGTGDTHVFVHAASSVPARVVRVDLGTGVREAWRELSPVDRTGVFVVDRTMVSGDGGVCVYSCKRVVSRLMLLEGVE